MVLTLSGKPAQAAAPTDTVSRPQTLLAVYIRQLFKSFKTVTNNGREFVASFFPSHAAAVCKNLGRVNATLLLPYPVPAVHAFSIRKRPVLATDSDRPRCLQNAPSISSSLLASTLPRTRCFTFCMTGTTE
jgi:hypothetical protein